MAVVLSILNVIFCIAFLWFAKFNLNDSDAWLWVSIYVVAAALCGLAAFDIYLPAISIVALTFYLAYAAVLFFIEDGVKDWITKYNMEHIADKMQTTKPYIEKTREFFGLLIISAALVINLIAGA